MLPTIETIEIFFNDKNLSNLLSCLFFMFTHKDDDLFVQQIGRRELHILEKSRRIIFY